MRETPTPRARAPFAVVRHGPAIPWRSLTPHDHRVLDGLLRYEADMAFRRRVRILIDYLELRHGDRVLDCGCGMGFSLRAMGKLRALRLVGLDTESDRLQRARRERVPASLVVGGLPDVPFAPASFDKVLMAEVLEHVDDDHHALREVFRVLKPGGGLALSVPHARYPFLWDPINRVWERLGGRPLRRGPLVGIWTNHQRLYEPPELLARLRDAGFQIDAVEEATHYSFPFSHFLIYGLGKSLLERGLLPPSLRRTADRFDGGERRAAAWWNPVRLGVAVFRAVDRLNDMATIDRKKTFVNILVKARRPTQR